MNMPVMYWSSCYSNPEGNGVFPLSNGMLISLTYGGKVEGHRVGWDKATGLVTAKRAMLRDFSAWRIPSRFGGRAEDGRTAQLLQRMAETGRAGGEPCGIPMPQLLARVTPELHVEFDDPAVQNFILDRVNFGAAAPSSKAPLTGQIEEIIADEVETLVGFREGPVMTLPPTARLKPWLKVGTVVQEGTVVADLLPRVSYTWEQLMASSQAERLVDEYIDELIHFGRVPLEIIPEDFRMSPEHGGYVLGVSAYADPRRKPVLVNAKDAFTPYGVVPVLA